MVLDGSERMPVAIAENGRYTHFRREDIRKALAQRQPAVQAVRAGAVVTRVLGESGDLTGRKLASLSWPIPIGMAERGARGVKRKAPLPAERVARSRGTRPDAATGPYDAVKRYSYLPTA
eukprot:COSAG01_NODE_43609_length_428_cov_0.632219_1_plen_119_part_01